MYMGLFERIYIFVEKGIIDDIDIINRLYGYRVRNIVANNIIRKEKLVKEADSWTDFIELAKLLNIEIS